jgi:hypothetical protein
MKTRMRKWFVRALPLLHLMLMASCAAPSAVWQVDPEMLSLRQDGFECHLQAVKHLETGPVIGFHLTVINHGQRDLSVDWNRSRYLHAGKANGPLVFAGADPTAVREGRLPLETLAPGQTLEKGIAPLTLLAKAPIRDRSVPPDGTRISGGPLPPGKNTVRLVIVQDGRNQVQDLTVYIKRMIPE